MSPTKAVIVALMLWTSGVLAAVTISSAQRWDERRERRECVDRCMADDEDRASDLDLCEALCEPR